MIGSKPNEKRVSAFQCEEKSRHIGKNRFRKRKEAERLLGKRDFHSRFSLVERYQWNNKEITALSQPRFTESRIRTINNNQIWPIIKYSVSDAKDVAFTSRIVSIN